MIESVNEKDLVNCEEQKALYNLSVTVSLNKRFLDLLILCKTKNSEHTALLDPHQSLITTRCKNIQNI